MKTCMLYVLFSRFVSLNDRGVKWGVKHHVRTNQAETAKNDAQCRRRYYFFSKSVEMK